MQQRYEPYQIALLGVLGRYGRMSWQFLHPLSLATGVIQQLCHQEEGRTGTCRQVQPLNSSCIANKVVSDCQSCDGVLIKCTATEVLSVSSPNFIPDGVSGDDTRPTLYRAQARRSIRVVLQYTCVDDTMPRLYILTLQRSTIMQPLSSKRSRGKHQVKVRVQEGGYPVNMSEFATGPKRCVSVC